MPDQHAGLSAVEAEELKRRMWRKRLGSKTARDPEDGRGLDMYTSFDIHCFTTSHVFRQSLIPGRDRCRYADSSRLNVHGSAQRGYSRRPPFPLHRHVNAATHSAAGIFAVLAGTHGMGRIHHGIIASPVEWSSGLSRETRSVLPIERADGYQHDLPSNPFACAVCRSSPETTATPRLRTSYIPRATRREARSEHQSDG